MTDLPGTAKKTIEELEKIKYPEPPKLTSAELNVDTPKTRTDHYEGIKAPPFRPLEESQTVEWIRSGGKTKQDTSLYINRSLPYKQLDLLTKYRSCNTRHVKEIGAFRTALTEVFGEAGYKLLFDIYRSFAPAEFEIARQRGFFKDAPNCSLKEIASYLATIYDIQGWPVVVAEATDKRVRIQLYKGLPLNCPYDVRPGDYRLCLATTGWEMELIKMCNPKVKFTLSRTKAIGDDCCEGTLELA